MENSYIYNIYHNVIFLSRSFSTDYTEIHTFACIHTHATHMMGDPEAWNEPGHELRLEFSCSDLQNPHRRVSVKHWGINKGIPRMHHARHTLTHKHTQIHTLGNILWNQAMFWILVLVLHCHVALPKWWAIDNSYIKILYQACWRRNLLQTIQCTGV